MEKQFSIRETLKSGWKLIGGENLFLLIGLYLGYMVVTGILSAVKIFMPGGVLEFVMSLVGIFVSVIWSLGIVKIYLQISHGEEPEFSSFKDVFPLFWKYLGAAVLKSLPAILMMFVVLVYAVSQALKGMHVDIMKLGDENYIRMVLYNYKPDMVLGLGLIILILPILYLEIRWMFYVYLIVDKKSDAIQSLQQSWKLTEGNFWNLLLYFLASLGLLIAGVVALVIGVFVAVPLVVMMQTLIYKRLTSGLSEDA